MKTTKLVLCLLFVTVSSTRPLRSEPRTWPLSRTEKKVSKAVLVQALPCSPGLISHWMTESGYAKEIRVDYAGYTFVRTDVGDPEGWLTVSRGPEALCRIELSLVPDLYFSARTHALVLSGYNGSRSFVELFHIDDVCAYQGFHDYTLATRRDPDVLKLLDEHDGTRQCLSDSH